MQRLTLVAFAFGVLQHRLQVKDRVSLLRFKIRSSYGT